MIDILKKLLKKIKNTLSLFFLKKLNIQLKKKYNNKNSDLARMHKHAAILIITKLYIFLSFKYFTKNKVSILKKNKNRFILENLIFE